MTRIESGSIVNYLSHYGWCFPTQFGLRLFQFMQAAQAKGDTFMLVIMILAAVVAIVIAITLYDHFNK